MKKTNSVKKAWIMIFELTIISYSYFWVFVNLWICWNAASIVNRFDFLVHGAEYYVHNDRYYVDKE